MWKQVHRESTGKAQWGCFMFRYPTRIAVILSLTLSPDTGRGLGGEKPDPVAERIADQLASYEILASSFLHLGNRGTGKGVKDFVIVRISRSDEPIELKYARCLSISKDGDIERPTLKGLVKATINLDTAVLEAGLKEPSFAEVFVKARVLAAEAESKDEIRTAFDKWEVRYNNAFTVEDAAKFLRTAAMIDSVTTKEHQEIRKQLRDKIFKVLAADPQALKKLARAAQPSDEVRKSRERVKELIEKAKKK